MVRQTLAGVTASYGASYELDWDARGAAVYNDPALVAETLPAMTGVLGEANVNPLPPFMVSEDFSAYQQLVPGFFYFLGVGNKAKGITAGWHTPILTWTRKVW